jgi:zinc/manganese transport system ATP-binding protein
VTSSTTYGPVVAVRDMSVSFAHREVLRDVNFRIDAGQFTGLIGTNGSGKTTLIRVILGLMAPTSGTVELLGHVGPVRGGAVGYVPQRIELDPEMPVRARDLVALGFDGHRYGFAHHRKQRSARVEELLHSVGAQHIADRRVGTLSGGEQQRILIAHALMSQPQLLLLDEPLANLDPASTQEIVALLARIATTQNLAVLLSAHEINPLIPVMDRVVYIAYGRVASGTTDQIVRTDVLSDLYGHHVDVVNIHGRTLVVPGAFDDETPVRDHPPLVME